MDHADSGLESRSEPLYYPIRRSHAAALNDKPFTQNSGQPRRRAASNSRSSIGTQPIRPYYVHRVPNRRHRCDSAVSNASNSVSRSTSRIHLHRTKFATAWSDSLCPFMFYSLPRVWPSIGESDPARSCTVALRGDPPQLGNSPHQHCLGSSQASVVRQL